MRFEEVLVPATLVRRYKRFLADVELANGEIVTAHCANSGSMMGLAVPGSRVWLSPNRNPKAKLDWRWELEECEGGLVGINTSHPNRIVEEAIRAGQIAELTGYESLRREVPYGKNSRIDILLEGGPIELGGGTCFVEVKNVTLRRGGRAEFPDAVTARGAKHLDEMAEQVALGHRAVMLYLIQRSDCETFSVAGDIDPAYAAALARATAAGVEAYAYACTMSPEEICIRCPVAVVL